MIADSSHSFDARYSTLPQPCFLRRNNVLYVYYIAYWTITTWYSYIQIIRDSKSQVNLTMGKDMKMPLEISVRLRFGVSQLLKGWGAQGSSTHLCLVLWHSDRPNNNYGDCLKSLHLCRVYLQESLLLLSIFLVHLASLRHGNFPHLAHAAPRSMPSDSP